MVHFLTTVVLYEVIVMFDKIIVVFDPKFGGAKINHLG